MCLTVLASRKNRFYCCCSCTWIQSNCVKTIRLGLWTHVVLCVWRWRSKWRKWSCITQLIRRLTFSPCIFFVIVFFLYRLTKEKKKITPYANLSAHFSGKHNFHVLTVTIGITVHPFMRINWKNKLTCWALPVFRHRCVANVTFLNDKCTVSAFH